MAELSARGFEQYGAVETDYGHAVRVYESSTADGPHVWINTVQTEESAKAHGLKPEQSTAHLDLVQAIAVRNLLDEFIDNVPQRWTDGLRKLWDAQKEFRERWPQAAKAEDQRDCQCCHFGNHDFSCTCDGEDCCHPDYHEEQRRNAAVRALHAWVGATVPRQEIEYVVARLKARQQMREKILDAFGEGSVLHADSGTAAAIDETAVTVQDDDPTVECACGTMWPDGVMGNGHGDMGCEVGVSSSPEE